MTETVLHNDWYEVHEERGGMPCGHPRACIVQAEGGTAVCAWCDEVVRLREAMAKQVRHSKLREESIAAMVGKNWIPRADWDKCQAEVERLREALAKQIHKRQSEVAEVLLARDEVDGAIAEWYDEYQTEVEQIRERLKRAAAREAVFKKAVDWLWGFWDGNTLIAAPSCDIEALRGAWDDLLMASAESPQSVSLLKELERLRALIPDAGMLDWLVKAAHRWWKDNGGEGTQKDVEAGYALVKGLYREANIGRE